MTVYGRYLSTFPTSTPGPFSSPPLSLPSTSSYIAVMFTAPESPTLIPEAPPCCDHCMPKDPSACCDVCNLDLVHVMIDDRDDNNQAVPRGSNPSKRPLHTLTLRASQFRDALYDWRTETATGLFGALDFWPADLLLHEEILEDIVVLVDANKILTVQDLREETGWILCDQYGDQIISLIQRFFPPTPLSNLFVSTPLSTNTQEGPYPSLECSEHAMRELTRTLDLYCVLSEGSQKKRDNLPGSLSEG